MDFSSFSIQQKTLFSAPTIRLIPVAYGRILPIGTWITLPTGALAYTRSLRIEVKCPYCGKRHVHGWTDEPGKLVPTRGAHCGRGEYFLMVAEGGSDGD